MSPVQRILRAGSALLVSNALAKVVGAITLPVITRLYSPSEFGDFSLFVSVSQLIVPFATMKYAAAIAIADGDRQARLLIDLSMMISASISILVAFSGMLIYFLGWKGGAHAAWAWPGGLAAMVLATGFYEAGSGVVTRTREFSVLAKTKVQQAVMGGSVKIILGFAGLTGIGLLMGQVVSQGVGASRLLRRFSGGQGRRRGNSRRLLAMAHCFADFPRYRVVSQFLLALSVAAPLFFARYFYTVAEVGQLGLALTIIAIPSALIGQSLANVIVGEISHEIRAGNVGVAKSAVRAVFSRLIPIACAGALFLFLFGEQLFVLFFGKKWSLAGELAETLAPCVAFQIVSTTAVSLLSIRKKQARFFLVNLVRLGFVLAAFSAGIALSLSIHAFVATYAVALCLYYTFVTWFSITRFES